MTENEKISMRETVKQCIEHSRWPPYREPLQLDERGAAIGPKQEPVDAFLQQLETWGYVVVSLHDPRLAKGRSHMSNDEPKTTLTDGTPVTADHRQIDPKTGMQKGYVVLSEDERAKGFVRPVRRSYVHEKCGVRTTMGQALAETYARQPDFYSGTFCAGCRSHFPVGADGEFVWDGTKEKVGT